MFKWKIQWRSQSGFGKTDGKSLSTDPNACVIKEGHSNFASWKTAGHIPQEISHYVYFVIEEENGEVFGTLKLLKYKASPILSGGLEVPLLLAFSCKGKWVVNTMEEFIQNFYTLEHSGNRSKGRTTKRIIIKLSLLNQKTRKMRRGKNINQTQPV